MSTNVSAPFAELSTTALGSMFAAIIQTVPTRKETASEELGRKKGLSHHSTMPPPQTYAQSSPHPQASQASQSAPRSLPMQPPSTGTPHYNYSQQNTDQRKRPAQDASTVSKAAKKKKPIERSLPARIETFVPESKLYTNLQAFEKKLDATIMRKRLDMQEAMSKPMKSKRILRVFLSNLSSDQPSDRAVNPMDDEEEEDAIPSWTFRMEGRLLDPPSAGGKSRGSTAPSRKFSSFFRSITVEFQRDPRLYPEGSLVEWHRPMVPPNLSSSFNSAVVGASASAAGASLFQDADGFEIKRRGDENVKVKIMLQLDHTTPIYRVSNALAEVLEKKCDTKVGCVMGVWQYIKAHHLQDEDEKHVINCDQRLQHIFGLPKVNFQQVPEFLNRHLSPPDPIVLEYTIRVDKDYHIEGHAYDIEVEVDDPIREKLQRMISLTSTGKDIQAYDDKITQCIQSISNSRIKRDFLLSYARSPVDFINKWVASQSRDLELILGQSKVGLEEYRRGEFYKQGWVEESIFHYLNGKTQRRMQELLSMK